MPSSRIYIAGGGEGILTKARGSHEGARGLRVNRDLMGPSGKIGAAADID